MLLITSARVASFHAFSRCYIGSGISRRNKQHIFHSVFTQVHLVTLIFREVLRYTVTFVYMLILHHPSRARLGLARICRLNHTSSQYINSFVACPA